MENGLEVYIDFGEYCLNQKFLLTNLRKGKNET